jgi:hypothetical protein
MKKIHQVVKSVSISLLVVLIMLSVNSASAGVLHFKMTAPQTTLTVDEEVTVTVSVWVDDPNASSGNGLITWQTDLSVDNTGIVEITQNANPDGDIILLAPSDRDSTFSGWDEEGINSPITGEVQEVVAVQRIISNPSDVGVGGYTDIFTFNIKALAVGSATYTICNDSGDDGLFYGALVDLTEYDNDVIPGSVVFDASSSNRTFTVIPEPCSLAVFALAGILVSLKKK